MGHQASPARSNETFKVDVPYASEVSIPVPNSKIILHGSYQLTVVLLFVSQVIRCESVMVLMYEKDDGVYMQNGTAGGHRSSPII